MSETNQKEKALQLLALHHTQDPLLLPNIWEPLGAAMLQNIGYPAVATSSSAIALTHGYADGEKISFTKVLENLRAITSAVSVPVTTDIEKGYAKDDNALIENIEAVLEAGACGLNLEDGDGQGGLLSMERQAERIRLIRETADKKGIHLVINARADTFLHSKLFASPEEQMAETLRRAAAYKEAGADCFFPILLRDKDQIATLVKESPLPVNIMLLPGAPHFEILAECGVRRISMGSSFLKVALQAMRNEALLYKEYEGFESIAHNSITSQYLENLISK